MAVEALSMVFALQLPIGRRYSLFLDRTVATTALKLHNQQKEDIKKKEKKNREKI